ncbi:hypothetical protein NIE88_06985 [Sporolactobacillus shoreicorticis]|uniref:Cold-shock protein n=1 Tax=Sporolactobacillus shoreicorticis TaxID=1923877 RepID=A0ABW5S8B3_9BACL|nr:hypothetical protein [Sporolactobacillus shoreicorticis]MCO7125514.1 hypothetical protein [Sporolactobacillus shoreicorticis]
MKTCPHYNGYQSGTDIRLNRSVQQVKCPVCNAELEVVVREETGIKEIKAIQ